MREGYATSAADLGRAIWLFIRQNVTYIIDPPGEQNIKTPAATLADGHADCKGYSILTAAILQYLGLPHAFRFTSYGGGKVPTHVYVVLKDGSKEVIIDACLNAFNREKPYTQKWDYMTRIQQISGIGDANAGLITDGELYYDLMREKLQLEREILRSGVYGIGASTSTHDRAIEALEMARPYLKTPNDLFVIADELANGVSGIGFFGKLFGKKKKEEKPKEEKEKKGLGKFLQKVGEKIKDGFKAFAKVITAPQRAFAQQLMKMLLPAVSPTFLYLFIKDPAIVSRLPATAARKRKKAQGLANFIINTLGMKEETFMLTVRNGIMKKMGGTPEAILNRSGISGITISAALITTIVKIVNTIKSLFKKGPKEEFGAGDLPDPDNDLKGLKQQTGGVVATDPLNPNRRVDPSLKPKASSGSSGKSTGGLLAAGLGLLALLR
ncbi:MAG: transglutaminase-like domain-containing protein [Bacteroidota bacterium]